MGKHLIGVRFAQLAADSGLRLDVATGEGDRLYGDDWYRFMADCRCVLGVESGVSAFDLEDEVFGEWQDRSANGQEIGIEDLATLPRWEDVVYYRTISPRHFEAAALRVCQVLFEGRYSGAMEPMVHYIPLAKDFSNINHVLELIRDPDLRRELTENAHRDLIGSGEWSYSRLIASVDETLADAGLDGRADPATIANVDERLAERIRRRRLRRRAEWVLFWVLSPKPIQRLIRFVHPVTIRVRRLLRIRSQDGVA